jgi:adenosylhomocysteine nucleosidase
MTALPAAPPIDTVAGRRVLFVMATRAEYGPALRARITPLVTGVGPVEAAVATTAALAAAAAKSSATRSSRPQSGLPDLVVSLGSAGSARLAHLALYQASAVAWRDIDASPLGIPAGITPFSNLPARLPLPLRLPDLPTATLSTGSDIVTGPAYDRIPEDMVDMETWAVLRACMTFGCPLIALRGISDGQAPLGGMHDWTDALPLLDVKLAGAVDLLAQSLAGGTLAL